MEDNEDFKRLAGRSGIFLKLRISPPKTRSSSSKAESAEAGNDPTGPAKDSQRESGSSDAATSDQSLEAEDTSSANSSPIEDWDSAYFTKLTDLCRSSMTDDEILMLPLKDIRGTKMLQLRLSLDVQPLMNKYNSLHKGDGQIGLSTAKTRFTEAFNELSMYHDVPLEDLKRAYNKITKASKAGIRVKRADSSKPSGVVKKRSSRRNPASSSSTTPEIEVRLPVRKRSLKPEIIGAPEEIFRPLVEMSEGERKAHERFEEVMATKPADMSIPRLPFYHAFIRVLNRKREIAHLHLESLKEIRHTAERYQVEAIVLSLNSWIPGLATAEQVQEVIDEALAEIPKRTDYWAAAHRAKYQYGDNEVIPP